MKIEVNWLIPISVCRVCSALACKILFGRYQRKKYFNVCQQYESIRNLELVGFNQRNLADAKLKWPVPNLRLIL